MQADAVVFLIDASDKSRFAESKAEMDSLLADEEVITYDSCLSFTQVSACSTTKKACTLRSHYTRSIPVFLFQFPLTASVNSSADIREQD